MGISRRSILRRLAFSFPDFPSAGPLSFPLGFKLLLISLRNFLSELPRRKKKRSRLRNIRDKTIKKETTSIIYRETRDFLTTISFKVEFTVGSVIVISGAFPTGIYIRMPTLLTALIPAALGAP
jgi:hypothetical protein